MKPGWKALWNGRPWRLPFAFARGLLGGWRMPALAPPGPLAIAWGLLAVAVAATVVALGNIGDDATNDFGPAAVAALPAATPATPEPVPAGPLPAWQANARPFPANEARPRLAVIVGGLGLNVEATQAAIKLPPEITLAFLPYGRNVAHWLAEARAAGHEVLLAVPMEPSGYPADDPGPRPLLASLPPEENMKRLEAALALAEPAVGITNHMGGRFLAAADQVEPLLGALSARGLLFVEQGAGANSTVARIAAARRQPLIAAEPLLAGEAIGPEAFSARLGTIFERARREQAAAIVVEPHPYVLTALAALPQRLDKEGVALAPVSALAPRTRGLEGAALPRP